MDGRFIDGLRVNLDSVFDRAADIEHIFGDHDESLKIAMDELLLAIFEKKGYKKNMTEDNSTFDEKFGCGSGFDSGSACGEGIGSGSASGKGFSEGSGNGEEFNYYGDKGSGIGYGVGCGASNKGKYKDR